MNVSIRLPHDGSSELIPGVLRETAYKKPEAGFDRVSWEDA